MWRGCWGRDENSNDEIRITNEGKEEEFWTELTECTELEKKEARRRQQ
jgi:hypothetical protein